MSNSRDEPHFDYLPQEIQTQIFKLLDRKTLAKICVVSKNWQKNSDNQVEKNLDEIDKAALMKLKKYVVQREKFSNLSKEASKKKFIAGFYNVIESRHSEIHLLHLLMRIIIIKSLNHKVNEPFSIFKVMMKNFNDFNGIISFYLEMVIEDYIKHDRLKIENKKLAVKYTSGNYSVWVNETNEAEFYFEMQKMFTELKLLDESFRQAVSEAPNLLRSLVKSKINSNPN